jgi:hypothetical protein
VTGIKRRKGEDMCVTKRVAARSVTLLGICGLALLAVSASASAASWKVEKAPLKGKEALSEKATTKKSLEISVSSILAVTCTSYVLEKSITEPITLEGRLIPENCKTNSVNCSIPSTLTTNTLVGNGTPVGAKEVEFPTKPKEGETLLNLEVSGERCPLSGVQHVNGSFALKLPEGQVEQTEHEATVSGSLKVGTDEATIKGAFDVKLPSGKLWSFS